jgi:hypothetical protein
VHDHVNVHVDVHGLVDVIGFLFGCGIGALFHGLTAALRNATPSLVDTLGLRILPDFV